MERLKEGSYMSDMEKIISEVDSSMAMEGMPLTDEDRERLYVYLNDPSALQQMLSELIKKHTAPAQ